MTQARGGDNPPPPATADLASVSVIINTYNRRSKLEHTLAALARQEWSTTSLEVVVVDDGSTDGTESYLGHYASTSKLDIKVIRQANRGPAAARNAGIAAARGELLVLIGDDMLPQPGFLQTHWEAHQVLRGLVVVGYSTWPPWLPVTPFLHYINEFGPQFGYSLITDHSSVNWRFFYSSNVSLPRNLLLNQPKVFDEDFHNAAGEDSELGYRLAQSGAAIRFVPAAVAWHDHPTTVPSFLARQFKVGRALFTLLVKHPELRPALQPSRAAFAAETMLGWSLPLLGGLLEFADRRLRLPLPHFVYQFVTGISLVRGYRHAMTSAQPQSHSSSARCPA